MTVAFLGFTNLLGVRPGRYLIVQPGPLQPHQIAPAQAGVESHQNEIAQPERDGGHQSPFLRIGEPAH